MYVSLPGPKEVLVHQLLKSGRQRQSEKVAIESAYRQEMGSLPFVELAAHRLEHQCFLFTNDIDCRVPASR
jgi:hypothetical protein